MTDKSVLTLCDILINRINLIKHSRAKRSLSLRKFSKDLIGCIKKYNTDVQELLEDACGSLYDAPLKRRRLSSMERSDEEKSLSEEETVEKSSESCGVNKDDSNLSDRNTVVTQSSGVTCTENNDKVMTALTPVPKRKSRRLTIFSPRKTMPNSRLATTVAEEDYRDDNESSCSCPSIVVGGTQERETQANKYIGDNIPNIIIFNSRQNIKQLDLLQLSPETVEAITKHLN